MKKLVLRPSGLPVMAEPWDDDGRYIVRDDPRPFPFRPFPTREVELWVHTETGDAVLASAYDLPMLHQHPIHYRWGREIRSVSVRDIFCGDFKTPSTTKFGITMRTTPITADDGVFAEDMLTTHDGSFVAVEVEAAIRNYLSNVTSWDAYVKRRKHLFIEMRAFRINAGTPHLGRNTATMYRDIHARFRVLEKLVVEMNTKMETRPLKEATKL
jgi:hypothetical protein